ncbi:MAB_1171c family putative transporter [Amycolatopsis sp. NPDC051071]|uniref:MAB_1171c family putative transporter n=1 Tax=Amycolatopsis sp. NPDC051071 TaxID=3154637 RepID=UPI00342672DB
MPAGRCANESNPRGWLGFRISAIGLAGTTLVAVVRSVVTIIRWTGHPGAGGRLVKLVNQLVSPAIYLFVAGVCYVGLAARYSALRLWLRRRQAFIALEPLWQRLHAVFPSDELDPARSSFPLRLGHRYWRRIIEIRDGLVQLGPHLIDAGYDPTRPAHEQSTTITTALQRHAEGRKPRSHSTVLVAAPTSANVDDDVDQLVRLSHALSPT